MSKKQELSKKAKQPEKKPTTKANANNLEYDGVIIENFGNTNFKVKLDINDIDVTGTISGKMRMNYIKVGVGDRVRVGMSPYDLTKCRIIRRLQLHMSKIGEWLDNRLYNNRYDLPDKNELLEVMSRYYNTKISYKDMTPEEIWESLYDMIGVPYGDIKTAKVEFANMFDKMNKSIYARECK